jgi:hypothetical protein
MEFGGLKGVFSLPTDGKIPAISIRLRHNQRLKNDRFFDQAIQFHRYKKHIQTHDPPAAIALARTTQSCVLILPPKLVPVYTGECYSLLFGIATVWAVLA